MYRSKYAVFCLAMLCTLGVRAQVSTPDASQRGPTVNIEGKAVIEPRTMAIAGTAQQPGSLKPEITTKSLGEAGYDLVCTYTNNSTQSKSLARLTIGALALGPDIQYLRVHRGSTLANANHESYISQAWRYPSEAFSPVAVLMNDRVAVGISLLYPVTEYKHDVLVGVNRAGGVFRGPPGAEGWTVTFDLSQPPHPNESTSLAYPASLEPGKSRTYTVAVRTMKRTKLPASPTDAQDWLETILPYRAFFQERFGPVGYSRNPDAVLAREVANVGAISATNPRGFLGDKSTRPDLNGFGPYLSIIKKQTGFKRVMLWAPSGLYAKNRDLNYPPQFTAGWDDVPLLRTTSSRLSEIPNAGVQLGLWWGRSTQHADRWDPDTLVPIDLTLRAHLQSIADQLTLAQRAGCTLIGMDNLSHWLMPAWDQRRLIRALRRTFPAITFVAEPAVCDFLQADAPNFLIAYQVPKQPRNEADFHRLTTPHYLADFLLPGHESWAYFKYSEITRVRPGAITAARVQEDAERLARLGYVPVLITDQSLPDPARARADETWRTTVPKELQQNRR